MRLTGLLIFSFILALFAFAPALVRPTAQTGGQKKEISFKAVDGITLRGTFYAAAKPGPGILLSHMCDGKGREAWDGLATRLAQAGFHVLTWNYRGVGESEGEQFRGGNMQQVLEYWRTKWGPDAEAALAYLTAQPGVSKTVIGAGGASCGVYVSLVLAGRHPAEVKTLVLLAGPVDAETRAFVEKQESLSILGVTSEEDPRSTAWTKEITTASKNPATKLVTYKDAGHGTQMLTKEKELEPMIVEWFKAKLKL